MINDNVTTNPEFRDTASNDEVISTLNGLIETCKDGQEGYKQASEGVQSHQLKTIFAELGQQRAHFSGELQMLVRDQGGSPETTPSTMGAIHRGWIDLKSAILGKDDGSILNECERGEDVAKKAYDSALETKLPANISEIVRSQAMAVHAAHDQIKMLRDTANGDLSQNEKSRVGTGTGF